MKSRHNIRSQIDDPRLTHLLHDEWRAEILAALQTEAPGGPVESGQLDADQLCHITVLPELSIVCRSKRSYERTVNDFKTRLLVNEFLARLNYL